jgi:hypothetical protein
MTSEAEREAGRRFSEMVREKYEASRVRIEDLTHQEPDQDEGPDDGDAAP